MSGEHIISVAGLRKRYGRTVALDGIDLTVSRGERFALLGPNGAGKTTLIHILTTILQPDAGSAVLDGFDVVRRPRQARRRLGVVFQETSLDTRLTVSENLTLHAQIYGVPRALYRTRARELLELVELTEWRDHIVRSLSKGMQRRLEIARALLHDSTVLILDEPTVGLDAQTRSRMWEYLRVVQARREITIVVTTHYIEEVDDCDSVCIVDAGRILASGSPQTLKHAHGATVATVTMDDEASVNQLTTVYGSATRSGRTVYIPVKDPMAVGRILAQFGGKVTSLSVAPSSLEGVFLDLTGRSIRDAAAGGRERATSAPMPRGEPLP